VLFEVPQSSMGVAMRRHEIVEFFVFRRRPFHRSDASFGRGTACLPFAILLALGVAQLFAIGPAGAQSAAASSAFGESISLSVLPLLGSPVRVTSGPLPFVGGTAPAPYALSNQLASIAVAAPGLGTVLTTKLLTVHASSPLPAAGQATADATVDDLYLRLAGALPLLTVKATTLHSFAQLSGACSGAPDASGSASLTNVRLGGSLGLGLTLPINPAPNTVLINLAGIRVVLNEQILAQSGDTRTLTVNALHISIQALPAIGLGLLSSDVVISQAKASLTCAASQADLAVAVTADAPSVRAGQLLTYTIEAANNGPLTARATTLTDTLPAGVDLISVDPTVGSCASGAVIVCDLGDLAQGAQATVTVVVQTSVPGTLVDGASITSTSPESNLADNQASVTTEVAPPNQSIVAHPR
jgi:uncharacterized repeat protein (TIGR01451 family)